MYDLRTSIIWLNAVLIILTSAALCSRVGRRVFVVGTFAWNDALISLAAACSAIFSVFQMVGTKYGLGLNQVDVPDPESNMPKLLKLLLASNVFYFGCNWAVKHALLLFYTEITMDRWHRISIYTMHFVAFGFGLSSILVDIFQCTPIKKAWEANTPGTCVNLVHFYYFNSAFMLATDLVLYIMPVIFTRKLQLRRMQRIGLNCLFALGGLVLAASAVRVWAVHMFAIHSNFTRRFAEAMICSVIENHLAVVVACAPSMKVVALVLFPRLTSSLNSIVSKVTRSSSRSMRSRSRISATLDLESGSRQSDKLRSTPSSTPLPSPVYTGERERSRASQNFAKWFKMPISPITGPGERDSMDRGLVLEERQLEDIRVEHTISVTRE